MALRVLLADESSSIKKVVALALQDFSPEIRAVNVGTDVLQVALEFKPDIVFADVLLPKRSGYEVCGDIKGHGDLAQVPVVLMWSGFMELDTTQAQTVRADRSLEKPFSVDALRALVQELVPRTREQTVAEYLHFPTTITELEVEKDRLQPEGVEPTEVLQGPSGLDLGALESSLDDEKTANDWDMESFEDLNKFISTEHLIQKADPTERAIGPQESVDLAPAEGPPSGFQLDNFELPAAPALELAPAEPGEDEIERMNAVPVDLSDILTQKEALERAAAQKATGMRPPATPPAAPPTSDGLRSEDLPPPPSLPQLDENQIRQLLSTQSREIIEAAVWKIVPEMAEQMIRRELDRLLAQEP